MLKDNKYVKIGVIFVGIVIVLAIIRAIINGNIDSKIVKYIEQNGYKLNSDNVYEKYSSGSEEEYNKNVSKGISASYSIDTFDQENFQITRDTYEYDSGLTSNLIATYDYTDSSLIYTYRVTDNNVNVIYMGDYNNDKFTCGKELSAGVVLSDSEKLICDKIEISILRFNLESRTFFKNADFASYMKKHRESWKVEHEERDEDSLDKAE